MQKLTKPTPDEILAWVRGGEIGTFTRYLVSGLVHGKPGLPVAEMARVEKILRKGLSAKEIFSLTKTLVACPQYTARSLACSLLEISWPGQRKVEAFLRDLAEDDDWIVRECAASSGAQLLHKDFPYFSRLFRAWVNDGSTNLKRAVALAVKYDSKTRDTSRWKTYLTLIEPLLSEEAEYVRKNLGPFAIGDGLLIRFPKETLARCKTWALSSHEVVRWNTAMVFTAAAARKYPREGQRLLFPMLKDSSPLVARAAKRVLKNLEK